MYRDFIRGNKLCYYYEQERMKQIHRRKLDEVSCKINTQIEVPMQNQNKKYQLLEDRQCEIERANRILLDKIQNIMKPEPRRRITTAYSQQRRTLNSEVRKKELIYNRLQQKRPSYDTRDILRKTSKQAQLAQQISEFSQSKRFRIMSASKRQRSSKGIIELSQPIKIILYKSNTNIQDKVYHVEVYFEDDLFKVTVEDQETKILEMQADDGRMILEEVYNNDILQLVMNIELIDGNVSIKGLDQYIQQ